MYTLNSFYDRNRGSTFPLFCFGKTGSLNSKSTQKKTFVPKNDLFVYLGHKSISSGFNLVSAELSQFSGEVRSSSSEEGASEKSGWNLYRKTPPS